MQLQVGPSLNVGHTVLLVSKWVSTMQLLRRRGTTLDKTEVDTLESICNFLRETSNVDITPQTCLAAELLRSRANFYDDIWVWRCKSISTS